MVPGNPKAERMEVFALKETAREAIYAGRDPLIRVAHEIHEHPEPAFCEEYAAATLTQFLAEAGFSIRKGVAGMPTAFIATIGKGPLHIAFCAEYDALPPECLGAISSGGGPSGQKRLGLSEVWLDPAASKRREVILRHACGHNLIAGAAVAAAIGLKDLVDQAGLSVSVFGTPGEELAGLPEPPDGRLAGGKIEMLKAGEFDGVHAALLVHPGPTPWSLFIPTHVYLRMRAQFSSPRDGGHPIGVEELRRLEDSLRLAVSSLHQVPALYVARPEGPGAEAQADFLWIAVSEAEGLGAQGAVRRCFEEAAAAAGAEARIIDYTVNIELRNDPLLCASYRRNSEVLGRIRGKDEKIQEEIRQIFRSPQIPLAGRLIARVSPRLVSPPGLFMDKVPAEVIYGSDLALVSKVIPSIHPLIGIGGLAGNHSVEFAAQADSEEGYRAMLDGGVALAWTALDSATDPTLRAHLLEAAEARTKPSSGSLSN